MRSSLRSRRCRAEPGGSGDPLLWYTLDEPGAPAETNIGSLGPAYDGILQGDAEMVATEAGFAVAIDGNGDWVIPAGNQDALDIGDGDFTLYARVTVTFLDPQIIGARGIIWKEETGNNPMYLLAVRNESALVPSCLADGDEFVCCSSTTELALDTEYELRAVRSNDVLYVFIDGCLGGVASVPETLGSTANDNQLIIGVSTVGQGQSGAPARFRRRARDRGHPAPQRRCALLHDPRARTDERVGVPAGRGHLVRHRQQHVAGFRVARVRHDAARP